MADVTGGFEVARRVAERRCEVCGALADEEQTSAHLARVHFFCATHGRAFHGSAYFAVAREAKTTREAWEAIDAWLEAAREEMRPSGGAS